MAHKKKIVVHVPRVIHRRVTAFHGIFEFTCNRPTICNNSLFICTILKVGAIFVASILFLMLILFDTLCNTERSW